MNAYGQSDTKLQCLWWQLFSHIISIIYTLLQQVSSEFVTKQESTSGTKSTTRPPNRVGPQKSWPVMAGTTMGNSSIWVAATATT